MSRNARTIGVMVTLLFGLAGVAAAEPGRGGFTFSPPPGWIDISRGTPEAQRQKAPPALLAQVNNAEMAFVAYEPDSEGDGFIENVNAIVQTGKRPPLASVAGLTEMEKVLEEGIAKQGMTYRSLKMEVIKVAGVTAGRLVGELKAPNAVVNLVQYAIPGDHAHATVTFTTTPERFAHFEPIFEAAVQATRGAVEPSSASESARLGSIVGGVAGALGALFAVRWRRKRQTAAAKPIASGPA